MGEGGGYLQHTSEEFEPNVLHLSLRQEKLSSLKTAISGRSENRLGFFFEFIKLTRGLDFFNQLILS